MLEESSPLIPGDDEHSISPSRSAAHRLEDLTQKMFAGAEISILCPYDVTSLPAAVIATARGGRSTNCRKSKRDASPTARTWSAKGMIACPLLAVAP